MDGLDPGEHPPGSFRAGDVAHLRDAFHEVGRRRPRAGPAGEPKPANPRRTPVDREGRSGGRQGAQRIIEHHKAKALLDSDHGSDAAVERADDRREDRSRGQESGSLRPGTAAGYRRRQEQAESQPTGDAAEGSLWTRAGRRHRPKRSRPSGEVNPRGGSGSLPGIAAGSPQVILGTWTGSNLWHWGWS